MNEPIQSQLLLFHSLKYVRLCRISEAEAYPSLAFGSANPLRLATGLIQRRTEDINLTILRRQQSTVGWPIWNPLAPSASASSRAFRNCVSECCASDSLGVESSFLFFRQLPRFMLLLTFACSNGNPYGDGNGSQHWFFGDSTKVLQEMNFRFIFYVLIAPFALNASINGPIMKSCC